MWNTVKSYVWWTHPRGSLPYDIMVTLILAFIFIAPRFIDFGDKPAPVVAHEPGSVYVVPAANIDPHNDAAARKFFASELAAQAGRVRIDHWEPLRDEAGNIVAYQVFVSK